MFEQVSEELLEKINLTNQIISDGELTANDFSLDFAQQIKDAGPWGKGFSEPIFDGEFELVDQKSLGKKHLKMIEKAINL